jgi:hypothetical protein
MVVKPLFSSFSRAIGFLCGPSISQDLAKNAICRKKRLQKKFSQNELKRDRSPSRSRSPSVLLLVLLLVVVLVVVLLLLWALILILILILMMILRSARTQAMTNWAREKVVCDAWCPKNFDQRTVCCQYMCCIQAREKVVAMLDVWRTLTKGLLSVYVLYSRTCTIMESWREKKLLRCLMSEELWQKDCLLSVYVLYLRNRTSVESF